MRLKPKITIADHFSEMEDPRVEWSIQHKLIDIITIAICAVICGADTWVDIEMYGQSKQQWLKQFLELANGIPSHDTFARVFARLDPEQFQQSFLNWIKSISNVTEGEVIAIDGKTLRHSYDNSQEKSAISMVSAWATNNRLVLGQVKVDEKSNEIKAIPDLIKVLSLRGCIVTIDAIGCQKEIVKLITEQEADYVITLKKNQRTLYKRVEALFSEALRSKYQGFTHSTNRGSEPNHGREETRYCVMLSNVQHQIDPEGEWQNLQSVGRADVMRTVKGKTKIETRYFISSLPNNAKLLAGSVRQHWGIENSLHWVLDVAFREDDSRIRKDNAPQNFAILRHIAHSLLQQNKSVKTGIKNKRLKAGWDNDFLASVLFG
jgi:predicted transposase YbfD/YdcC